MKRLTTAQSAIIFNILLFFTINVFPQEIKSTRNLKLDSLEMYIDSSYIRLPGYQFPVAFKLITNNKTLYTKGLGGGKLRWNNFKVVIKGGTFNNGNIHISNKLFPGDYIEITVSCKSQPLLVMTRIIRLNYIESLKLIPLEVFRKIPGERFNFGMKIKYDNGCKETISSWSQNYKLINSLKFDFITSGGKVKNNSFSIDPEIDNIQNHTVYLIGQSLRVPYTSDSLGILLDYRGDFNSFFKAADGSSGSNGSDGSDGSGGSESSNGGSGQSGSNGGSGDNGNHGYNLDVFCDAYYDSILQTELLYIEVNYRDRQQLKKYLVNPDGGSIKIISAGGDGGSGGKGGDGGNGGSGGTGRTYIETVTDTSGTINITHQEQGGNGGNGGQGGDGGYGGDGGNGGFISISYTPMAQKYLSCIKTESRAGSGGNGGSSGNGGSGGTGGSPGGRSGTAGSSGSSGSSGDSGNRDETDRHLLDE